MNTVKLLKKLFEVMADYEAKKRDLEYWKQRADQAEEQVIALNHDIVILRSELALAIQPETAIAEAQRKHFGGSSEGSCFPNPMQETGK